MNLNKIKKGVIVKGQNFNDPYTIWNEDIGIIQQKSSLFVLVQFTKMNIKTHAVSYNTNYIWLTYAEARNNLILFTPISTMLKELHLL